jgi:iron complex outermembrane receptor protein
VVYSASLAPLVTFLTSCATPAQIAALKGIIPQTGALPNCALYLFKDPNSNYLNLKIGGIDASIQYNWEMEGLGSFKVGTVLNQFLQFDEAYGIGAQGSYFSVLGTTGSATSFPSVSTQMRSNIGWAMEDLSVDLFMNYTAAYRNWGTPVTPITLDANKNPSGGGDHVAANVTFDLHLSYTFDTTYTGQDEVSVNIRNLFDRAPPFYNSSVGYDSWVANPYGRIIQLGVTAKL